MSDLKELLDARIGLLEKYIDSRLKDLEKILVSKDEFNAHELRDNSLRIKMGMAGAFIAAVFAAVISWNVEAAKALKDFLAAWRKGC